MATLVVHPAARPLAGSVPAPPDRDAGEVAVLLAALASGPSVIGVRGAPELALVPALRALGAAIEQTNAELRVQPPTAFRAPREPLRAGPAPASLPLLCGLLAAQAFASRIDMDRAFGRALLQRATRPLRLRGARIEGRLDPATPGVFDPPVSIEPCGGLSDLRCDLEPGDAAGKLAALASGLFASGDTLLSEAVICCDGPTRMLRAAGVDIETAGGLSRLRPLTAPLAPFASDLPGELDGSLLLLASALAYDGSRVGVRGVGSSPSDAGALAALLDGRAELAIAPRSERLGQAIADVTAGSAAPHALAIGGERGLQAGVSLPAVAAWAARARGRSRLGDIDARPGRSEQPERVVACLRAFGIEAAFGAGGLEVEGRRGALVAADIDARGDEGIAMLAVVLALGAAAPCRVAGADGIVARFPRFVGSLRALGARVEVSR